MVNTEIRLIILLEAEDGGAQYSQQKQDWELAVDQIMNSLCKIQTYIKENRENHEAIQERPKSNLLWLDSGDDKHKTLDFTNRVPEELWMEVCDIVQEVVMKTIPKKKKC